VKPRIHSDELTAPSKHAPRVIAHLKDIRGDDTTAPLKLGLMVKLT
jgi:hypothetical protein